jgi:mannose-6-phosphate isomerase
METGGGRGRAASHGENRDGQAGPGEPKRGGAMKASETAHPLPANHVPVYYAGGANIDRFRRRASATQGPEDWVGSVSALPAAILPSGAPADTGVSRLADGTSLRAAVRDDRAGWLGPDLAALSSDGEIGLLVKLLDAGERLPVHAHPDRPFAAKRLGSPYGKTEGWIVMDDGPGGDVWLGFRETISRERLARWIEAAAVDEMLAAMNRLPALPGAVFYVPAGVPHAIGAGVMITELQEPTSLSILAEYKSFGLNEQQATLGLGWQEALGCFDLSAYAGDRLGLLQPRADTIVDTSAVRVRRLFDTVAEEFFQALRAEVGGAWQLPRSLAILIVEAGAGTLRCRGGEERPVAAGETWVIPFDAAPAILAGALRCLLCLPPGAALPKG